MRISAEYYALIVCDYYQLPHSVFEVEQDAGSVFIMLLTNKSSGIYILKALHHQEPLLAVHDRLRALADVSRCEYILAAHMSSDHVPAIDSGAGLDIWRIQDKSWVSMR